MADENDLKCDNTCCTQNLVLVYEGEEFREYLEHHVANYQLDRKDVSITLQGVHSPTSSILNNVFEQDIRSTGDALFERINSFPYTWDGVVFPGHMMGALQESNRLWDWNDYLRKQRNKEDGTNIDMEWMDIHPFFRSQAQQQIDKKTSPRPSSFFEWQSLTDGDTERGGVVHGKTLYAPLDGDVISLYYRKDLFEKYGIPVPRTWDEYTKAAIYFYGKPWGPNNSSLSGSCIARRSGNDEMNSYWAALVLSTMTQTKGTSSGFLLDPETADPILGEAMDETLMFLAHVLALGKDNSDNNTLNNPVRALNEGSCAMTLSWANPLTINNSSEDLKNIGVAPTPGSKRVLDRKSGKLETCTPELCPYGIYYDNLGIVNRPSFSAYGAWAGGVSNDSTFSKQKDMADFFSYISKPHESLNDVLPNERSNFVTPYRYSHTMASNWADKGFDNNTAFQYTETIKGVNSENTVSELRVSPEKAIRGIINEEVNNFLADAGENKYEALMAENDFQDDLRSRTTASMDQRIREAIEGVGTESVVKSYQSSLSFHNGPENEYMYYIDIPYRDTGWGVAILICFGSMAVIFWVLWNRKKPVMRAFQPILLIQSAIGFFIMGATLVPLGFDDSLFSEEILDITCMATPWMYVFGYTIFFSSIYSKIQVCTKIYEHPGKYDRMMVRPINSLKLFCKIFALNGVLLGVWTAVDPLQWSRTEKTISQSSLPYGTVESYGSCKSEKFAYPFFAIGLFVFNLLCCFIAMLQALRCRMLVLEYRQMQWLQLCIIPFFEAWIIGGPVLAGLYERPTAQYVSFVLIIASSTIASASAIFGPKEWYVRKHNVLSNESQPTALPPPFVRILKHPKFESQKHVSTLQNRLERYTTANTELAIDIRVLQEKFRLLTEKEKLAAVRGSIYSRTVMESEHSRIRSMMLDDEEVSKSDTKNADIFKTSLNVMRRNSFGSNNNNHDYNQIDTIITRHSTANPRVSELSIDMDELNQLRAEAGRLISHEDSDPSGGKSGRSLFLIDSIGGSSFALNSRISEEMSQEFNDETVSPKHQDEESVSEIESSTVDFTVESTPVVPVPVPNHASYNRSKSSYSSGTKDISEEMEDLNEMIESDNIRDLKSETMMMAEEFKMNSSFLENVSDLRHDNSDKAIEDLHQMVHSDDVGDLESEMILIAEEFKMKNGLLESISDLEGGEGKEIVEEEDSKHEPFHTLDVSNATATSASSATMPTENHSNAMAVVPLVATTNGLAPTTSDPLEPISSTGESSGVDIFISNTIIEKEVELNDTTDQNAGEPSSDYRAPLKSNTVSIEGWTPTSSMLALLNDVSDSATSTSASSRADQSLTDSIASLEIVPGTPRTSGVQMGKDIKSLLNHHGFDAVESHTDAKSNGEKSESSSTKLSNSRQKKRELEAKRLAIRRHQQKGAS